MSNIYLTSTQLFRLKILLKRSTKKSELTRRYLWIQIFPNIPITKKPQGLRMGKGKGKNNGWSSLLKSGNIFLEFKNLREGRSRYFYKQISNRLQYKTIIVFKTLNMLNIYKSFKLKNKISIFF